METLKEKVHTFTSDASKKTGGIKETVTENAADAKETVRRNRRP
jgi:hypothetical protein